VSLRSGSGALNIRNPTPALLRAWSRKGHMTQAANANYRKSEKQYTDKVPF
jgi:hypothetical protein